MVENRLSRPHAQGTALSTLLGLQLETHPVPGEEMIGNAPLGRRPQHPAVAGLIRRDEGLRAQGR